MDLKAISNVIGNMLDGKLESQTGKIEHKIEEVLKYIKPKESEDNKKPLSPQEIIKEKNLDAIIYLNDNIFNDENNRDNDIVPAIKLNGQAKISNIIEFEENEFRLANKDKKVSTNNKKAVPDKEGILKVFKTFRSIKADLNAEQDETKKLKDEKKKLDEEITVLKNKNSSLDEDNKKNEDKFNKLFPEFCEYKKNNSEADQYREEFFMPILESLKTYNKIKKYPKLATKYYIEETLKTLSFLCIQLIQEHDIKNIRQKHQDYLNALIKDININLEEYKIIEFSQGEILNEKYHADSSIGIDQQIINLPIVDQENRVIVKCYSPE